MGEHHLVGMGTDEPGDLFPGLFIKVGGLRRKLVEAPVDVGVGLLVKTGHRLDDLPRLLAGGRRIQVHERVPVHGPFKDGKVLPHSFEVDHPCAPSKDISRSLFSSTEYSSGISFRIGETKPFTIRLMASASDRPRDIR